MRELQEKKMALVDASLFLDTHPDNQLALEYFKSTRKEYLEAAKEYEANNGPITMMSTAATKGGWQWATTPWPWEREV